MSIEHFILVDAVLCIFILITRFSKNFIFNDLSIKVTRAELRLQGIQNMLTLVHKDHLIPSVKYSILCGWQGLLTVGSKQQ